MTIREELAVIGPLVLRLLGIIGGAALEARKDLDSLGLKGRMESLLDSATVAQVHALDTVFAQIHVQTKAGKMPTSVLLHNALRMGRELVHKLTLLAAGEPLEAT